mmetsp:Transcript_21851/g.35070  ORF Transcript_21851/g.35070 Transcript_21851/m.35070 type:complete len:284 (-) Transcript_21851:231-1082(-)
MDTFSLGKGVRRSPELISLVCIPLDDATQAADGTRLSAIQATATGDTLKEFVEFGLMPHIERSTSTAVGVCDSSKRTLGAPVVVSFDMDGLSQGLIAGEQVGQHLSGMPVQGQDAAQDAMRDATANLAQNYGILWEQSEDFYNIEIPRATEYSTYQAENCSDIQYLYQTEPAAGMPHGGHYIRARNTRMLAHATYRNMLLTDTVGELRWHMAVLWPSPLTLTDIVLVEKGVEIPIDSGKLDEGYGTQKFLDGTIQVYIYGKPIKILDPQQVVGGGGFFSSFFK